jgi:HEAT repeat protein/beta-lactamase regulating signal transducer with metallopeptidase domain
MTDQLALRLVAGIFVKGTAALAVTWILTVALRRRAAAVRHAVWTAAMAVLLALPALGPLLPRWEIGRSAELSLVPAPATAAPALPGSVSSAPAHQEHEAPRSLRAATDRNWRPWAARLGLGLWAAGVALGLAWLTLDLGWIGAVRRRAWIAGRADRAVWYATAMRRSLGLRRAVPVAYTTELDVPAAIGWFRPTVLLPDPARRWPSERLRTALLHELAHVARRDALPHLLAQLVRVLYWPNPLVWVAARQALLEQEQACDDTVLRCGAGSQLYAEHLVAAARDLGSPAPAAALAMARPHTLARRVSAILRPGLDRAALARKTLVWAGAGAVLAAVPLGAVRLAGEAREVRMARAALTGLLSDRPATRAQAAWVLGDVGARRGIPALRERLTDTDAQVRGVAAWALGEIGTRRAVPDLVARLEDRDPYVREAAVLALGRLGAADALDRLAALRHDSVMGVRAVLTVTLQRLGGRTAAGLLGDLARHDPDAHARGMALEALCQTDETEARAALADLLRDPDPGMRVTAAQRLGDLATPALIPALTAALEDPVPWVRGAAAAALGATGDPAALPGLRRAQADSAFGVRVSANYALGTLGGAEAAAALLQAMRDPVHQVRLSAVEALDAMQGR